MWISTVFVVPVRAEVGVDDLTNPLDVDDLLHSLSAGIDGYQVVSGVDEISGPTTAESASPASSSALTTSTGSGGATDWSFGRAQIHFTRRAAPTLPSSTATR